MPPAKHRQSYIWSYRTFRTSSITVQKVDGLWLELLLWHHTFLLVFLAASRIYCYFYHTLHPSTGNVNLVYTTFLPATVAAPHRPMTTDWLSAGHCFSELRWVSNATLSFVCSSDRFQYSVNYFYLVLLFSELITAYFKSATLSISYWTDIISTLFDIPIFSQFTSLM